MYSNFVKNMVCVYMYTDIHIYAYIEKIRTGIRYTEELIIVLFLGGGITDDFCFLYAFQ